MLAHAFPSAAPLGVGLPRPLSAVPGILIYQSDRCDNFKGILTPHATATPDAV